MEVRELMFSDDKNPTNEASAESDNTDYVCDNADPPQYNLVHLLRDVVGQLL